MVSTQQSNMEYANYYGFSIVETKQDLMQEVINNYAEAVALNLRQRAKALKPRATGMAAAIALQADIIQLPFQFNGKTYQKKYGAHLYLGGVDNKLRTHSNGRASMGSYEWITEDFVYVGPLPAWVCRKYVDARRYFAKRAIAIISSLRDFFCGAVEVTRGSPLLVAFSSDFQLLLAAWGLEYEHPFSHAKAGIDGSARCV